VLVNMPQLVLLHVPIAMLDNMDNIINTAIPQLLGNLTPQTVVQIVQQVHIPLQVQRRAQPSAIVT